MVKESLHMLGFHGGGWKVTNITLSGRDISTYDHSSQKIRDPVRSPLVKPRSGRLVVGSVTTSEYRLLYVYSFCFLYVFFFKSPYL
jgi:hypothetical protein